MSLNAAQTKLKKEFMNFTGVDEKTAISILKKYNFDVNQAVNKYFESESKSGPNAQKYEQIFNTYMDSQSKKIEAEGIQKFCNDLGISPMDAVILVISYYFGAKKSGEYTKEEFCQGMSVLKVTSIAELKANIPHIRNELMDEETFKKVYKFTFNFSRESKNLEFESARALWEILLPFVFHFHKEWLQFLDQLPKEKQKDISQDLWNMLLEFHIQVRNDLSKYDPYSAWPSQIDEFMEFMGFKPQFEEY
ncbi:RP42, putative [Ichthyophthirius multifiliis]|uniref:Defective in cullin neddylation protein n=1 Tax=Ichthyophthirius multifiliis TaxID=5932 RepID=G0R367_ICHMU|nr:RP42, putative [Ichthyophthirius multifiliis]EGR28090.1 RP42, putative [Ichthyophthirius multifiliis]|eukprot:XP_004027435.1 RP42, putative [Ichthyophthirius multifiliis]